MFAILILSRSYVPLSEVSNIPRIFRSVDFPDPEEPIIATNSPSSTEKSIPFNT